MSAYRNSRMPRVVVKRSARAEGPFIRQSLRDLPDGCGCFMALFMQILSGVVACGPFFSASTMVM